MEPVQPPQRLYIDKHDNLYSADSESGSVSRNHPGWKRGIRIGSVKDGKVVAFIPDPTKTPKAPARPKASPWPTRRECSMAPKWGRRM